jgi:hypothetical protein
VSTQVSRYRYGEGKVGFMPMTPADGSSGIVATTWVVGYLRKTHDRSSGGRPFAAI